MNADLRIVRRPSLTQRRQARRGIGASKVGTFTAIAQSQYDARNGLVGIEELEQVIHAVADFVSR